MNNPLIKKFGDEKRWVNWRLKKNKKGELTKVPYTITGKMADSTDPDTWAIYKEVSLKSDKIGIVFALNKLSGGIDLDHCLKKGTTEIDHPEKEKIIRLIKEANTYTEISPSGTGLHLYFLISSPFDLIANKYKPTKDHMYEVYNSKRYFTVTGNSYNEQKELRTVTPEELITLLEIIGYPWGKKKKEIKDTSLMIIKPQLDDQILLNKMFASKKGERIRALYNSDTSAYKNDDSSAEMALCSYLAFWTRKDAMQMERIWLASPLGSREKTQQRKDYREMTIAAAISTCNAIYEPKYKVLKSISSQSMAYRLLSKDKDQLFIDMRKVMSYAFIFPEKNPLLRVTPEGQFYDYNNGVYRMQTKLDIKNRIYRALAEDILGDLASPTTVSKILSQLSASIPSMTESDTDINILNLKNGLLDLRSMTLLPHSPDYISTSQSPASYVPEAKCDQWLIFMDQVTKGDRELIDYMQEVVGYCALTNDTSHHAAFFIYGPGGNGKGTFTLIISSLVDQTLVYHASVEQITGRFGGSQMIDKRLVILDEPNLKEFKSEVFRKYVSGEPSFAEKKGVTEMIPFKPRARFIITTNEPPRYDEANDANARRFHIIPFTNKFEGDKIILNLSSKIISEERDGILLWAIEGLKRLQKRGVFLRPEIVIKEQKIIRRDNSSVRGFFDENFKVSIDETLCVSYDKNEIYELYRMFCKRNGVFNKSSPRFIQDMKLMPGIKYDMNDDSVVAFTNLIPLESLENLKERYYSNKK
jgi:putative DNA primase/helicase